MARRTSRRRTTKNRRSKGGKRAYYLHYKTPKGFKKVMKLGTAKDKAGHKLKAWKTRTRGKGYRILRVFSCAGGLMKARSLVAPKRKTTKKNPRRTSRKPRMNRRRRSRRSSRRRRRSRPRRNTRRRTSRRRAS